MKSARPSALVRFLLLALLTLVAGCAPRHAFVLLPDADGRVGQIEVTNPQGAQILSEPRQVVRVAGPREAPRKPEAISEKEIQETFGRALAIQPEAAVHFLLYFETNSVVMMAESKAIVPQIIEAIKNRRSVDTSVVGHTDTAGSKEYNYRLSHQRAEVVAKMLIEAGVDPRIIEITSHGKDNPLVPTGDNVSEPRNRRVEVTVR